jgi:hypothetical protein
MDGFCVEGGRAITFLAALFADIQTSATHKYPDHWDCSSLTPPMHVLAKQ